MFKQFLGGVEGIDQYLIFSMIVFLLFFTGVLLYVIFMKKEECDSLSSIPLNDSEICSHEE